MDGFVWAKNCSMEKRREIVMSVTTTQTVVPKSIYGLNWHSAHDNHVIILPFPWGKIQAMIWSFSPYYAKGKTLPVYDSEFWMWSVSAYAHFQLQYQMKGVSHFNWDKNWDIAEIDCRNTIIATAHEFELLHQQLQP